MSLTAEGGGAVFDVDAPISLEGATVKFIVNVSNEFKASGANLQPFAQLKQGNYPGHWSCWLSNEAMTPGVDQEVPCLIDTTTDIFNSTTAGAQVGLQGKEATVGSGVAGTVLVKSTSIIYPGPAAATVVVADFESDAVDSAVYGVIGYNNDPTATVVTIASVTGLPANGTSTKVAKVATTNWDTIPKFTVTLPVGKTLANYQVKVDAYFPRATLGLTADGDNFYKDFLLFAGTAITGSAKAADNPTFYQSKIGSAGDMDKWKTFTLTVDATKAAALSGTIEIGLGLNRPPLASINNAYYFDNITLVELP